MLLEDVMPANLRRAQEEYADLAAENAGARGRLKVAATIEDAVREADVAVDVVPDELESKLEIFCLLDRMAPPRTVIATPTGGAGGDVTDGSASGGNGGNVTATNASGIGLVATDPVTVTSGPTGGAA